MRTIGRMARYRGGYRQHGLRLVQVIIETKHREPDMETEEEYIAYW